jgi:predicted RNA binding protein YcfA (HicA-like mRNA interferase family)
MPIKVKDMIRRIEADGWYYVGSSGGHRQYKHPVKKGKVTIPGKASADIPHRHREQHPEAGGVKMRQP